MTANIIINNYYYRYRQQRKDCKTLVDNTNYTQARTQLQNMIAEHTSKYPDSDTRKDFNYGEKIIMNHALRHLDAVIDKNDPTFLNTQTGQTEHQSDIVKDELLRIPKPDYSIIVPD